MHSVTFSLSLSLAHAHTHAHIQRDTFRESNVDTGNPLLEFLNREKENHNIAVYLKLQGCGDKQVKPSTVY